MTGIDQQLDVLKRRIERHGGKATHVAVNPETLAEHPDIFDLIDLKVVADPMHLEGEVTLWDRDSGAQERWNPADPGEAPE